MKTRAELIEGLTNLQMGRIDLFGSDRPYKGEWTPNIDEEYKRKSYMKLHDDNCKLSTRTIKQHIKQELFWKLQTEERQKLILKIQMEEEQNGTTTKI